MTLHGRAGIGPTSQDANGCGATDVHAGAVTCGKPSPCPPSSVVLGTRGLESVPRWSRHTPEGSRSGIFLIRAAPAASCLFLFVSRPVRARGG
jgi:hypothetical protein